MSQQWQQQGNEWCYGDLRAEQAAEDRAFVITTFGTEPDADAIFDAIRAAMPFGKIRLRVTPETRPIIEQLVDDRRIGGGWTVGVSDEEEYGVMRIKTK